MSIENLREQFMVYIVDDEASIRSILMEALGDAGYQVRDFPSADDAFKVIPEEPPHIILSDIRMPGMSGIDLLGKVREISEDIQFIIMTSHASLDTALQAIKLGAYDYLHKPFEDLGDVIVTVDRTVEMLFLQYQNEQLLEELENKNKALTSLNSRISKEKEEIQKINHLMSELSKTAEVTQVVDIFLKQSAEILEDASILFLKHLPSYRSLSVSQAHNVDPQKVRGAGISFKELSQQDYIQRISSIADAPELAEMLVQVFQKSEYVVFPLSIENQLAGAFVFLEEIHDMQSLRLLESFVQVVQAFYFNAVMQRRIHDMAIKDPLTTLYNRRFFNERIEEEINRSRRTRFPLSCIYLDIDHFKKYNDQNGHQSGDVLLKQISALMKKSSRKTDIVARLGGEEFCILLPHTDAEGAAIKAEKLRRLVEGTNFANREKQPMGFVSISVGVSEYPSHAHDADALVKAADDALYNVKESSRNRVALASVGEGFKRDFEPLPVPKKEAYKK
ncbi:MAG: diguanylate cyclase [Bdellovibrionota bacterium]|nr:hypothetical protein [Pseudobdellovibrionaceae bacterium]